MRRRVDRAQPVDDADPAQALDDEEDAPQEDEDVERDVARRLAQRRDAIGATDRERAERAGDRDPPDLDAARRRDRIRAEHREHQRDRGSLGGVAMHRRQRRGHGAQRAEHGAVARAQDRVRERRADERQRQHDDRVGVEVEAGELGDDHVHRIRHDERRDAGREEHRERERDRRGRLAGVEPARERDDDRREHEDRGVVVEQRRHRDADREDDGERVQRRACAGTGLDRRDEAIDGTDLLHDAGQDHDRGQRDQRAPLQARGVDQLLRREQARRAEQEHADQRGDAGRDPPDAEARAQDGEADGEPERGIRDGLLHARERCTCEASATARYARRMRDRPGAALADRGLGVSASLRNVSARRASRPAT